MILRDVEDAVPYAGEVQWRGRSTPRFGYFGAQSAEDTAPKKKY